MDNKQAKPWQFQEGNQAAKGHGRPPKVREAALLAITHEIVNAGTWRQVVAKRVLDALGKIQQIGPDGITRMIDDPNSTATGRNQAATWLRDTVIGKPTEYVNLDSDTNVYEQFSGYSDDELGQILALIRKLRQMDGGGESDSGGTSEADATNSLENPSP